MKKAISLMIALVISCSMLLGGINAVNAVAAEETVVTVSSCVNAVKPGDKLSFALDLSSTGELGSIVIDVNYNKDLLVLEEKAADKDYFNNLYIIDSEDFYGYDLCLAAIFPDEGSARFTIVETGFNSEGRLGGASSKLGNSVSGCIAFDFKVMGELKADDISISVVDLSGALPSAPITSSVKYEFNQYVDYTSLEEAIKAAELKISEIEGALKYEEPVALKEAVEAARVVLEKVATQAEVDAAVKALINAVETFEPTEIIPPADKTALNSEIEKAEAIDLEGDGIKLDMIDAFKEALEAAKAVAADENALQADIDAATAALKDAMVALVDTADVSVIFVSVSAVIALLGAALILLKRKNA